MQDLLWREDDMDHFLHTVASFETHKRLWKAQRAKRRNPSHIHYGKQMPRMIPPSYVRLFQITLSQTHSSKFRQHFGATTILDAPFQLLWGVTGSQVAESATMATNFQRRLFTEDTRLAIDSKTSFLDDHETQDLVTQVRGLFTSDSGTKLWLFVMKRVREIQQQAQAAKRGEGWKQPSPVQLRMGYEQILGARINQRWRRKRGGRKRAAEDAEPKRRRRKEERREEQAEAEVPRQEEEEQQQLQAEEEEVSLSEDEDLRRLFIPDWGEDLLDEPEAARRPPPTEEQELDDALAVLMPPDERVAVSAAPVYFHVAFKFGLAADKDAVDEAAHAAYEAIAKFRTEMVDDRISRCSRWIQNNMRSFHTLAVQVFGSKCYYLELCSSDADMVVTLGPGQNPKAWLNQLHYRVAASQSFFTCKRRLKPRDDCLQTEFLGVPVDLKVIKNNRASDAACRSSDTLRFMIEQRLKQGNLKHRAILIFKLLCHHLNVVQHHWQPRAGKFKAVSLCYWAVAALDHVAVEDDKGVPK